MECTLSEEREVCDALVHRLHRELGHSDTRGMVDSLRQNRAHPTVLAAAKLMQCTACQESARMLSRLCPVGRSWSLERSYRWTISTGSTHEGGACQRHAVGGCLFESGCGPDLANYTPSGTSSEADATRVVVQVSRTSRTVMTDLKDVFENVCFGNGWPRRM